MDLLGAQVSALSEEIEKVFNIFLQIWPPDRATIVQNDQKRPNLYNGCPIRGPNLQRMMNNFSISSDNAET